MEANALLMEENCFSVAFLQSLTYLNHVGQQKKIKNKK